MFRDSNILQETSVCIIEHFALLKVSMELNVKVTVILCEKKLDDHFQFCNKDIFDKMCSIFRNILHNFVEIKTDF
jgi:hypothetical protein